MIGPECVAQQKKLVSSSVMNCGDLIAWETDMPLSASPETAAAVLFSRAGGRRTSRAAGIITAATMHAMISIEVRQSWIETSHAASGDMVIGAMPMPAETSDTARLRWVSNQPVTQAIIGAKIAEMLPPMNRPKVSWNASSEVVWLASARLMARIAEPVTTTKRVPNRSDRLPQAMLVVAIARNAMVMALDTPVTDQPVSRVMAPRKTGSENIAPIATQPSRPPATTMTH